MTSIGRFSYDSETTANPSVPTIFLALTGPKPFTASNFIQLWQKQGLSEKHPRFEQRIDTKPGFFSPATKPLEHRVADTMFPSLYRADLAHRMSHFLTAPLTVKEALWEVRVATGAVGTSGAISKIKSQHLPDDHTFESLILFRHHHALADGVSLAAAFVGLFEEAEELKQKVKAELKRRSKKAKSFLQKILKWLQRIIWFCHGSIQSIFYQTRLLWGMPQNPLELVLALSGEEPEVRRTVSWCDAAPLDEVKQVAHAHGRKITVNDVWVSCVSYAIAKQLEQHRERLAVHGKILPVFDNINVVVPVHLSGGVMLPNQSLGNFIGAFVARVPGETSADRLAEVHETLSWLKRSPVPLIGYLTARTCSLLPVSWTKSLFRKASANACVSISNVRSSPLKLHLDGNTVQSIAGFLPLPPGIPVGVVITSYAGSVSLTVTAQPWAVPDADQFMLWMLEEYQRLLRQSGVSTER
jgi:diacylglycerol O-acyltransferase